jgi:indole-3-glycerol phosphate synthase
MGADALLIIVSILSDSQLKDYITLTRRLCMDALVEIHTREDLDRALCAGARIIGINNRNLDTLATNLQTTLDLSPHVPKDRTIISESGISGRTDIKMLMAAGVHAFLIGETLMKSGDVGIKLKELLGHDGN